jgi:hypothetical protein
MMGDGGEPLRAFMRLWERAARLLTTRPVRCSIGILDPLRMYRNEKLVGHLLTGISSVRDVGSSAEFWFSIIKDYFFSIPSLTTSVRRKDLS